MEYHSGFTPLAIFRDRLSALMYAYSLSTPDGKAYMDVQIFTEDGTTGYEDPPAGGGADPPSMNLEEKAYVKRLGAKLCKIDLHYKGLDDDPESNCILIGLVFVFPLEVMNPPTDTISPHVNLTCTIWEAKNWYPCPRRIVIKCEGCDSRQCSRDIPFQTPLLVCESEVEYFPFGMPFLFDSKFANRLSRCLAKMYPNVSCTKQIPIELAQHVATFLPFEIILEFLLKLPGVPRAEEELKQRIILLLPKRITPSLKLYRSRLWPDYDSTFSREDNRYRPEPTYDTRKPNVDYWEDLAKRMQLKYAINYIPKNANWSSLRFVVIDDSEVSAVRKVISFLRNRIPSKYLLEKPKCVIEVLMISSDACKGDWDMYDGGCKGLEDDYTYMEILDVTETLKLELYTVNGLEHCAWYLIKAYQPYSILLEPNYDFPMNSTIIYLKESSSNSNSESKWDTGNVVIYNLTSYLVTAYDHNIGTNCDSSRDEDNTRSMTAPSSLAELSSKQFLELNSQNMEFLLSKILMDVNNETLRQLWIKIATVFQISNFSFINHQDQTTPVNTPTDLVVLTDYTPAEDPGKSGLRSKFFSDYLPRIRNSALATAYRNNSGCLKTLKSFIVNVVVLSIGKYGQHARGDLRQVSRYRLEMSTDHKCEILTLDESAIPWDPRKVLSSLLAFLRHRPAQVECWDRGQGGDFPLFRNPFGFVVKRYVTYNGDDDSDSSSDSDSESDSDSDSDSDY